MLRLGAFLVLIGFGSVALHYLSDRQFVLISWAEEYQPSLGIVVGVVGIGLAVVSLMWNRNSAGQQQPAQQPVAEPQPHQDR